MRYLKYVFSTSLYGIAALAGVAAAVYFFISGIYFLVFLSVLFFLVAFDNFFCGSRLRKTCNIVKDGHYIIPPFLETTWNKHKDVIVFVLLTGVLFLSFAQLGTGLCDERQNYCAVPEGTPGALELQYPSPVVPATDVPFTCSQACGAGELIIRSASVIFEKVLMPFVAALVIGFLISRAGKNTNFSS